MGRVSVFILATVSVGLLVRIGFLSVMALGSVSHPAGYLYFYTGSYLEVFLLSSAAGILFARRDQFPPKLELVRRPGVGVAIVLLLVALGWVWKFFLWSPAASSGPAAVAIFFGMAVLLYAAIGLMIAVSLLWLATHRDSMFSRFLKLPLLQALGTLSYGIYMWHLPAKFALYGFDVRLLKGLEGDRRVVGVLLMFLIYLAFVVALAGVTFWTIEAPANKLRRILDSKRERFDKAAGLDKHLPVWCCSHPESDARHS
jgi:peptidoglycan/LPS O-acetylase OafA/YrhL